MNSFFNFYDHTFTGAVSSLTTRVPEDPVKRTPQDCEILRKDWNRVEMDKKRTFLSFTRSSKRDLIKCKVDPTEEMHMKWDQSDVRPLGCYKPLPLASVAGVVVRRPNFPREAFVPGEGPFQPRDETHGDGKTNKRIDCENDFPKGFRQQDKAVDESSDRKISAGVSRLADALSQLGIDQKSIYICIICHNDNLLRIRDRGVYCTECESLLPFDLARLS